MPAVGAGLQFVEPYAAILQDFQDHVKMFKFLRDDFCHLFTELPVVDVVEHQIHRGRRRFLLTVSVIDQNIAEVRVDLSQPAIGGC